MSAAPERGLPNLEAFEAVWRRDDPAYALVRLDQLERLRADGLLMRELARDFDHALVSRR